MIEQIKKERRLLEEVLRLILRGRKKISHKNYGREFSR